MNITYKKDGDKLWIRFDGELDHHNAESARRVLDNLISGNYSCVVFDFKKLSFMDSTGIGVLLGRYKKLKEKNASVYCQNATGNIDKLLKLSGIYNIFIKI